MTYFIYFLAVIIIILTLGMIINNQQQSDLRNIPISEKLAIEKKHFNAWPTLVIIWVVLEIIGFIIF